MSWIQHVPASDAARRVLQELVTAAGAEKECKISVSVLARRVGVSKRTVLRVLPRLEELGLIERDGGERKVRAVRLKTGDNDSDTLNRCHQIVDLEEEEEEALTEEEPEEQDGDEYMALADPRGAWRDRMIYVYRTGKGLPHWREAGEFLVAGGDRAVWSPRALAAVERGE